MVSTSCRCVLYVKSGTTLINVGSVRGECYSICCVHSYLTSSQHTTNAMCNTLLLIYCQYMRCGVQQCSGVGDTIVSNVQLFTVPTMEGEHSKTSSQTQKLHTTPPDKHTITVESNTDIHHSCVSSFQHIHQHTIQHNTQQTHTKVDNNQYSLYKLCRLTRLHLLLECLHFHLYRLTPLSFFFHHFFHSCHFILHLLRLIHRIRQFYFPLY